MRVQIGLSGKAQGIWMTRGELVVAVIGLAVVLALALAARELLLDLPRWAIFVWAVTVGNLYLAAVALSAKVLRRCRVARRAGGRRP